VLKLRQMIADDYDAVYSLWLKTPGMGLNDVDDSRAGITKYLSRNPGTCFVAEDDEQIVGVILAGHDGRRGYIHHACVAVRHWNSHIGTRLVGAAVGALRAEGITKVAMVVFRRNERGNGFWQRLGFTDRPDLVYRDRALAELRRMDT